MLNLSKKLKMLALAGLSAATLAGFATPASARTYTQCGPYRCYRVVCDWDGDRCHRVGSYERYRSRERYRDDRRYVCDRDGDDCHWVRGRGDDYRYRNNGRVYLRLNLGHR
jgi:hypothetical protein